jgi:hypothetical protein
LPDNSPTVDGLRRVCIAASDAAGAIELANLMFDQDLDWNAATAVGGVVPAGDFEDWVFQVNISVPPVFGVPQPDLTCQYVGVAADTIHEIGANLSIACNTVPGISASIYTPETRTLTVAAIADGLGDRRVRLDAYPPGAKSGKILQVAGEIVELVTDGAAIAGADLLIQFAGAQDLTGYRFEIRLAAAPAFVQVTAGAGDLLSDVCDDLVVALGVAGCTSSWDPVTRILIVSALADGNGADVCTVDVYPPLPAVRIDASTDFVVDIVDQGPAAADVTVEFIDAVAPQLLLVSP